MKLVYFAHSLSSCWNHGNAHFMRGVLRAFIARGDTVSVFQPAEAWSLQNLLADQGPAGLDAFHAAYPELAAETGVWEQAVDDADLVVVHEWNEPALVAAIGQRRRLGGRFTLLFHDTHHRAVSDPEALRRFDLAFYDGVLAFGETLAGIYRGWGWGERVWVWHEAADTSQFKPPAVEQPREGLVWIGNWGDGERTAELREFLLRPAENAGLPLDIHGVRYPDAALKLLARHGAAYRGWLANAEVPAVFARHLATVHVPRRFYAEQLPGIPTIRVFEALACGIPLVSAPWDDSEGLFRPGEDYLIAEDGAEMARLLVSLRFDPGLREALADSGLARIRERHTCTHRMEELLAILATIGSRTEQAA